MTARKPRSCLVGLLLSALTAAGSYLYFAEDRAAEPYFGDESAHIAQTYYDRLWTSGDWNHPDWLHLAAYEHGPIYKYLMGTSLALAGESTPNDLELWAKWHRRQISDRDAEALLKEEIHAGRSAMIWGAVLGCVMIFLVGRELSGPLTGLLAAAVLAASPLYYTHARRAMADDWTQALLLASFVAFLGVVRLIENDDPSRQRIVFAILTAGLAGGLASATKLNGAVAMFVISIFAVAVVLAGFLRRRGGRDEKDRAACRKPFQSRAIRLSAAAVGIGVVALAVFVGVNPYFFARPDFDSPELRRRLGDGPKFDEMQRVGRMGIVGRTWNLLQYRADSTQQAAQKFPNDELPTITARAKAILWNGMYRYSFVGGDGTGRGVAGVLVIFLVLAGIRFAWREGRFQLRAGAIPTRWLLVIWPITETAILLLMLTVDWDRYYMGVVTWSSLLSVYAVAAAFRRFKERLQLIPEERAD